MVKKVKMIKIFGKNYQNLVAMTIGIGHVTKIFVKNYQNLVTVTTGIGPMTNFGKFYQNKKPDRKARGRRTQIW